LPYSEGGTPLSPHPEHIEHSIGGQMKVISHRGYWESNRDQNTAASFRKSIANGFGIETDIRDLMGELVISHDLPKHGALTFNAFLKLHRESTGSTELPLALNIKCDGLQALVKRSLEEHSIRNYFLFDMSVPDMLLWSRAGLRFFTRQSELEPTPSMYQEAAGVWMDCFFGDWIDGDSINKHIRNGKQVCVVSPELHKRPHLGFWGALKQMDAIKRHLAQEDGALMLCTDFPDEAREHFHG
jgi:glycerophosphoryl diester phosphodiesterase